MTDRGIRLEPDDLFEDPAIEQLDSLPLEQFYLGHLLDDRHLYVRDWRGFVDEIGPTAWRRMPAATVVRCGQKACYYKKWNISIYYVPMEV